MSIPIFWESRSRVRLLWCTGTKRNSPEMVSTTTAPAQTNRSGDTVGPSWSIQRVRNSITDGKTINKKCRCMTCHVRVERLKGVIPGSKEDESNIPHDIPIYIIWQFPKIGGPPVIIDFSEMFPYKPFIWIPIYGNLHGSRQVAAYLAGISSWLGQGNCICVCTSVKINIGLHTI